MVTITNELLEANGFLTNHPERELKTYYLNAIDAHWRIELSQHYKPQTNTISYNLFCWYYSESGNLEHWADVKYIKTFEDLNKILDVCEIPQISL